MATRKQRSDAGKPREVTQRRSDAREVMAWCAHNRAPKRVLGRILAVFTFLDILDGRDDMPKQRARKPRKATR